MGPRERGSPTPLVGSCSSVGAWLMGYGRRHTDLRSFWLDKGGKERGRRSEKDRGKRSEKERNRSEKEIGKRSEKERGKR